MNRNEIINACRESSSKEINLLIKFVRDAKTGLVPYPEASGSSRTAFGAGYSAGALHLAELIVDYQDNGGGGVWEDVTQEAMDTPGYGENSYIEIISGLRKSRPQKGK